MIASFSLSNHMLNQLAKLKILLASLLLASVTIMPAGADDHAGGKPTGREIMRDAYALMNHFPTVMAEIDLKVESKGKSRERQLVLKTKHSDANTKIIAKFTAPDSARGVGYASLIPDSGAPESWIYLPSLGSLRKLKGNDANDSFFGSDFSYNDIAGRSLDQDTHRIVNEDERNVYIESRPKDKDDNYARFISVIRKSNKTIRSVTFFDKRDRELKRLSNKGFQSFDGLPVIAYSVMENLQTGSVTHLDRGVLHINAELPDSDFGPDALKR